MTLRDRVCLVTGATSGVGFETACALARRGARVILGCRTRESGRAAQSAIESRGIVAPSDLFVADLADLEQVRMAALDVCRRHPRLHLLVNNAGVYLPGATPVLTRHGFEATFAINHLAHVLLTELVLDRLLAGSPSRIVVVASEGFRDAPPDLTDIERPMAHDGDVAYDRSKLACVLFTAELARRLTASGVTVNCLHPGEFSTGMFRHCSAEQRLEIEHDTIDPREGMQLMLQVATDPALDGVTGAYFVDEEREPLGDVHPAAARHLWDRCHALIEQAVPGALLGSWSSPTQRAGYEDGHR